MSDTRMRAKAAAREDGTLGSRRQSKVKYLYRLLRPGDIGESLASKTVYVLWPDDGTWYKGQVAECDAAAAKATVYYEETEETEECDLKELVQEGQIAFKEPRPVGHKRKAGEVDLDQRYFGRQPGDPELEDSDAGAPGGSGRSSGEEEADAGALEDDSDSDVSFSSAELTGRKRKRGGEESDEDVVLEEFEKREIMRDMSDDEKPLGYRADELERKQKRQQPKPKQLAAKKPAAVAAPKKAAAAEPAVQRRRREAAAGVAAAVQAVAAVQAAAAADASSDEEPPSARKHRQRQAAAVEEDDEEEAEAFARNLLARVTNKPQQREGFYGRQGSGGRELERRVSVGQTDEELQLKVRAGFQQALELVAGEAAGAAAGSLPEAALVAEAVEGALFRLHGGVTKDYKAKFRTLQFNLKDPQNPDLRAHVLRGDIAPDAFVRMTATELANKELAAYRKAKEEEALKMSVLDAEAAAKFSTAAALDARDQLAIPASVMADKGMLAAKEPTPEPAQPREGRSDAAASPSPRDQSTMLGAGDSGPLEGVEGGQGSGYRVSDSAELAPRGSDEEYDPETAFADADGSRLAAAPAGPAAAGLDWAAIKKAASAAAAKQQAAPALAPLDVKQGQQEGGNRHRRHGKREHASPLELPSPHEQAADQPPASPAEPDSPTSLRHLVLPAADPAYVFGKRVWEGQFLVPGTGAFQLSADALAGAGDVAALLGDQEIEVKGRLALQKLDRFLTELRHSRSRTVTLALLSPAEDCSPEERAALQELVSGQYQARERTGVANPARDVEAYLVSDCQLAERLVAAARAAAPSQVEALLPGSGSHIGSHQLLLAIIHRRDWRFPRSLVRPVRRPRAHPAPGAAAAAEPATSEPAGGASAPALPPPPSMAGLPLPLDPQPGAASAPAAAIALPEGLDFGAISALAAAFGVAPAASQQQQQQPAAPPSGQVAAAGQGPPGQPGRTAQAPAPIQLDQLQQLLASLPPSAVVPGAVAGAQQPAGQPRRSRWAEAEEAAAGQQAAPPPQPSEQQPEPKKRRTRWGDDDGGEPAPQQGLAHEPAAPKPPSSGPMGPMQRAGQLPAGQAPTQAPPPPPQQQLAGPGAMPPAGPYSQQFAPEASFGLPPPPQYPGAAAGPGHPRFQQPGMAPLGQTGSIPPGSGPYPQQHSGPMGLPEGPGPQPGPSGFGAGGSFSHGPPMHPSQHQQHQQLGRRGPPLGDGRGGRFNGRFGGGRGRWDGRDGGRGRGSRHSY